MKWKPNYAIGVDVIDEQHKRLFDLAEEAEALLELPDYVDKYDEIVSIVQELKDYVVYHFEEEEKLLLGISYNKFFSHQVKHQEFILKMNEMNMESIAADQLKELLKLTTLVTSWLLSHVLRDDIEWAVYYKEKQNS